MGTYYLQMRFSIFTKRMFDKIKMNIITGTQMCITTNIQIIGGTKICVE